MHEEGKKDRFITILVKNQFEFIVIDPIRHCWLAIYFHSLMRVRAGKRILFINLNRIYITHSMWLLASPISQLHSILHNTHKILWHIQRHFVCSIKWDFSTENPHCAIQMLIYFAHNMQIFGINSIYTYYTKIDYENRYYRLSK